MERKGRFIVFEGIDGSGKTTQCRLLAEKLRAMGKEVVLTAEPTDSECGRELRAALGGKIKKSECEMALMFVEDRIGHNIDKGGIREMLESGKVVICDRYYYSTLAYQGHSTDYEWVKSMNLSCPEITRPDICIYLDLLPEQSLERIKNNRGSVEIYENEAILGAVRDKFFKVIDDLSNSENIVVVNAYGEVEDIAREILEKCLEIL